MLRARHTGQETSNAEIVQYTLPLDDMGLATSAIELQPQQPGNHQVAPVTPEFSSSPNPHFGDFADPDVPAKVVDAPYSLDISAGKNTYVYDAHTYHTKVPPQGIAKLVDYYTNPGDVVLDPFCGSGMTGVAVLEQGRKALLCDLSPAATFIAYNFCSPISAERYLNAVRKILRMGQELENELYNTHCRTCGELVPMLYTVWSYGMVCKSCNREFNLWDVARDERSSNKESKIKGEFDCPYCGSHLKKRELKKTRRYPVSVGYRCCQGGAKETTAPPDDYDRTVLAAIERRGIPGDLWYPTSTFPEGVNTRQPIAAGVTSVDKAYTTRALWAMAYLWDIACRWPDSEMRPKLLFTLTSLYQRVTVFSEFRFWGGSGNTANYNVPAIMNEQNVFKTFERKANTISWYFRDAPKLNRQFRVTTQSACHLTQLPDKSVHYVFADPPFGSNLNYSEMNFLWESWLGTYTDTEEEAIVNKVQGKGLPEYEHLLTQAFQEMHRVLKDGGWMTIVFHNSSARIWDALQRAIAGAGFVIVGTQTFDKKHGTFKQFVSKNAVGYDLVLHCQKSMAIQPIGREDKDTVRREAASFLLERWERRTGDYIVHYLHVARDSEFDYRRLYAEWLAQAIGRTVIGLSFDEFQVLVDEVLKSRPAQEN
jgi:DNA modification methylase